MNIYKAIVSPNKEDYGGFILGRFLAKDEQALRRRLNRRLADFRPGSVLRINKESKYIGGPLRIEEF
jgi:hypothetical protein